MKPLIIGVVGGSGSGKTTVTRAIQEGMQVSAAVRVTERSRTSEYARAVAELLARETPKQVTAVMAKDRRTGKIFVDWSQNNPAKTTIAPYSLRARAAGGAPTVSTPLHWDEVEAAGSVAELTFSPTDVLARARKLPRLTEGDLVILRTAGAYGMSMSSQYNARPRAAEVLVEGDRFRIVRRRETHADLVRGETT